MVVPHIPPRIKFLLMFLEKNKISKNGKQSKIDNKNPTKKLINEPFSSGL